MSAQFQRHQRLSSSELDPYSAAHVYYGDAHKQVRNNARVRTYSTQAISVARAPATMTVARRSSHDEQPLMPRKFLIPVEATLETLLAREDTDQNLQITIEDAGPKVRLLLGGTKLGRQLTVYTDPPRRNGSIERLQ